MSSFPSHCKTLHTNSDLKPANKNTSQLYGGKESTPEVIQLLLPFNRTKKACTTPEEVVVNHSSLLSYTHVTQAKMRPIYLNRLHVQPHQIVHPFNSYKIVIYGRKMHSIAVREKRHWLKP